MTRRVELARQDGTERRQGGIGWDGVCLTTNQEVGSFGRLLCADSQVLEEAFGPFR